MTIKFYIAVIKNEITRENNQWHKMKSTLVWIPQSGGFYFSVGHIRIYRTYNIFTNWDLTYSMRITTRNKCISYIELRRIT